MKNIIKLLVLRKIACTFSLLLAISIFGLFAEASIEARWAWIFSGIGPFLMALIVWFFWMGHFIWLLAKCPRMTGIGMACLSAFALGLFIIFTAGKIASHIGTVALKHDLQPAIDAGLYKDCLQLMQD